jgi:plastocyanin
LKGGVFGVSIAYTMSNKIFFGILVLVAGVLTGWFLLNSPSEQSEIIEKNVLPVASVSPALNASDSGKLIVTYTDSGFSPLSQTVKKGSTITYMNESSRGMWVASGVHPTHQLLPGFDQLLSVPKAGIYEYTFTKTGTWSYHNHVNPTDVGTIVVTD